MLTIVFCTAFGALKFQNFLGQNAPGQTLPPPPRRGLTAWPCCWNSQLLYSNLLTWGSRPWYGMVWIFQEFPNMSLPLKNVQNVQSRGFCPKESNSKCFFTLTIKKPSTLYNLLVMKNSISSTGMGGGGWGFGISPFLFCTRLHMPGLCWFLLSRRNKAPAFTRSVSQYLCIHDHSFIHVFSHSLLHSCVILSWIMNDGRCIFQIYLLLLGMSFDLLHLFLLFFFIIIYCLCLIKIHLQLNEQNNNQN